MPTELFVPVSFKAATRKLIRQANGIIDEYRARGFVLTLRQLYYIFASRNIIENTIQSYKRLGSIINDARLAGRIDWEMIEDRTREIEILPRWNNATEGILALAEQYRTDIWRYQPYYIEVWFEKAALTGVIEPACTELRVPYFACRGNVSQSEQWRAGHRFRRQLRLGQKVLVIHLGDHDPNGVDMTRDNRERLAMFAQETIDFELRRIALNMEQIKEHNLLPQPVKEKDSRSPRYQRDFGDESWELDALDPSIIDRLIRDEIEPLIDRDAWETIENRELETRLEIQAIADRYPDVSYFARKPDYE